MYPTYFIIIIAFYVTSCSFNQVAEFSDFAKSDETSSLQTKEIRVVNKFIDIVYFASLDDKGRLQIEISIDNNEKVRQHKFTLDVKSSSYKLDISKRLESYASNLLDEYDALEARLISQSLLSYIDTHPGVQNFREEEAHGLFYIIAIFSAIDRYNQVLTFTSLGDSPKLEITAYEGYITGLTPFRAKEDIILNISDFKSWLDTYSGNRLTARDIAYIKDKLKGLKILSLSEYQNLVHTPLQEANRDDDDDCWILCGGDCGCCGNYEGQCYYANDICYVHDYLCESCEPAWFCLSGCQPTPC